MAKRKRALILKLRRNMKAHRWFDIEDMGDGREKQTCRDCGKAVEYRHPGYNAVVKRHIAYRAQGGVFGQCPTCSKCRGQERYPMPAHLGGDP